MFTQKSLWEKFLDAIKLENLFGRFGSSKTYVEVASEVVENEIRKVEQRLSTLLKLRETPERFVNKLEAIRLAEEMSRKLHERRKRLYLPDEQLTPEEAEERRIWRLKLTPREECTHGKGGAVSRWGVDIYGSAKSWGLRPLDYNVACHTFPDGSTKIWCLSNCGFAAWKKSDGTKDENWAEAVKMIQNSTNTQSSSERFISEPLSSPVVVVQDRIPSKGEAV